MAATSPSPQHIYFNSLFLLLMIDHVLTLRAPRSHQPAYRQEIVGLGSGLDSDLDPGSQNGFGLSGKEDEPQVRDRTPSTLPDRYMARESRANRSLWPTVWPLQIEIDLHNLPTAVSDRDRQNSRSKTLLPRLPPTVAVLQCCIAAALCVVKACEMDGTCRSSINSRWSRVTERLRFLSGPGPALQHPSCCSE